MVYLNLQNDYVVVSGDATNHVLKLINDVCSYEVKNVDFMYKYQSNQWDGKISLFKKKTLSFPAGLLDKVASSLTKNNVLFTVVEKRTNPKKKNLCKVDLGEHSFRDYQQKAIETIKTKTRGILAMCTGAGKTKTSCGIISELSVYPVIFIVPSVQLLYQTADEFRTSLKSDDENFLIGELGGGKCNIEKNGINVATYQTLLTAYDKKYSESSKKIVDIDGNIDKTSLNSLKKELKILSVDLINSPKTKHKGIETKIKKVKKKIQDKEDMIQKKKEIRDLVENCQLLFIDETHIAAVIIEEISLCAKKAYYKCGLTGTPQRMDNQDIRMFGATGSVIHEVTSSDLIKRDFLVKPYIYCIDLDLFNFTCDNFQQTYTKAIVENQHKNELIRDLAQQMHSMGRPTLIMVERIPHGKILEEMIEGCVFVPGGDGSDDKEIPEEELNYRKYQLNRLEKNEIIMCATSWCYTGIDAPKISCIILACSLSSTNTITQQIGRGLRKAPGKKDCVIFDFRHKELPLRKQFNSRNKVYSSEEEFVVKILKYNNSKGTYV